MPETPQTYIFRNATCKIGQRDECGEPAAYVIAVTKVAEHAGSQRFHDGGVVFLCERHATTPVPGWS